MTWMNQNYFRLLFLLALSFCFLCGPGCRGLPVEDRKGNTLLEKIMLLEQGQFDIQVSLNKQNTDVIGIKNAVDKKLSEINKEGGLIGSAWEGIILLILTILGIKNTGQIIGFIRLVLSQFIQGRRLKKTKKSHDFDDPFFDPVKNAKSEEYETPIIEGKK